jgi:hypothetical protein
MRVLAKAKLKPALRLRYTKTKAAWPYGKAHLPTRSNNNVLRVSSNHGETIYAQHAWASFHLITGVTLTTSPSPDIRAPCETYSVPHHCSIQFKVRMHINVTAPRNQNPSTWDPTSSSMLGGRMGATMNRQEPRQNRTTPPKDSNDEQSQSLR